VVEMADTVLEKKTHEREATKAMGMMTLANSEGIRARRHGLSCGGCFHESSPFFTKGKPFFDALSAR